MDTYRFRPWFNTRAPYLQFTFVTNIYVTTHPWLSVVEKCSPIDSFILVSLFFVKLHNHIDIVTDYMSVACYDTSSCQLKTKERRDQFIYNNVNISGNMIQYEYMYRFSIFSHLVKVPHEKFIICFACFLKMLLTINNIHLLAPRT